MQEFGFILGDEHEDFVAFLARSNKSMEAVEAAGKRVREVTGVDLEDVHHMLNADKIDGKTAEKIAEVTGIELVDPVHPLELADVWIALLCAVDPEFRITIDRCSAASLS